jgi:hypothetical protein
MDPIVKKCIPKYFQAIWDGKKTFDMRTNIGHIEPGLIVQFDEYDNSEWTGRSILVVVTYVLYPFEIENMHGIPDTTVFSFEVISQRD